MTKKAGSLTPLSWVHGGEDWTGGDKGNKDEESVCKGLVGLTVMYSWTTETLFATEAAALRRSEAEMCPLQ